VSVPQFLYNFYWNFISFWFKKIPSEKNDFSNRIRKMVFNKKPVTDEMAAIPKPATQNFLRL
jgi:hypothetical protein